MFCLAGFVAGAGLSEEEVGRQRAEAAAGIHALGGRLVESDTWDPRYCSDIL